MSRKRDHATTEARIENQCKGNNTPSQPIPPLILPQRILAFYKRFPGLLSSHFTITLRANARTNVFLSNHIVLLEPTLQGIIAILLYLFPTAASHILFISSSSNLQIVHHVSVKRPNFGKITLVGWSIKVRSYRDLRQNFWPTIAVQIELTKETYWEISERYENPCNAKTTEKKR